MKTEAFGIFNSPAALIGLAAGLIIFIIMAVLLVRRGQGGYKANVLDIPTMPTGGQPPLETMLGKGAINCIAFKDGCVFPTTIEKPIGYIFMADSTMWVSGPVCLVKEENKKVVAYEKSEKVVA